MATADQYLSPIDVRDSHVLTRVVERRVREDARYNIPFAPLVSTTARKIKLRVRHVDGSGLASFKADNANTPIVAGSGDVTEVFMELFTIGEKEVLKASDLVALRSPDPEVARTQASEIVAKAVRLRQRNVNRTKWMAWQAVQDSLTVTYPDGTTIAVDYDLDKQKWNSWFSASHKGTVNTAWSDVSSDIIGDVYDCTYIIAEDLGVAQSDCIMYVSPATWRNMRKNTGIKAQLSTVSPRIITPTMAEVTTILDLRAIRIYSDFYVDTSDAKQKFLDDGHVLFTGGDSVNGDNLMEVKDGPVARVVNGDIVVASNPGAESEIYVNEEQVAANVRVQTARVPEILYPAAFYWLDISP